MRNRRFPARAVATVPGMVLVALTLAAVPGSAQDMADCELTFTLRSWSAFYKSGKGEGTVTCDNGERADVRIKVKGGGLSVGRSEILDGKGKFSEVRRLSEVFGSYAAAGAHAGAVKSSEAVAMTKGEVSLALAGTGRGFDVGVTFSKFTIRPR
ncbi:MAG TPA: hypothetical protein VMV46_12295 [Thermoanaerobaculia bacterium]|nr:hypothetical protein [Thermoanaerobaculia bacterium]